MLYADIRLKHRKGGDYNNDEWIVVLGIGMKRNRLTLYVFFSLLLHILVVQGVAPFWSQMTEQNLQSPLDPMLVTMVRDSPQEHFTEDNESGQIVDLPTPLISEDPLKADYLAEDSRKVEKEEMTQEIRMNPEVVSDHFSDEEQLQYEDLVDLNATEPSTGATPGAEKFRLADNGPLAALPSPFLLTNKKGLHKPTLASSTTSNQSGAPNNDLLEEEMGARVQLNTHAYRYASYMNQIRRLVNFFWSQNLQNLDAVLIKPSYRTVVSVKIDSFGGLHTLVVQDSSGIFDVDLCVVDAFHLAAPFPPPPTLLVEDNGLVQLPVFGFELKVGSGQQRYEGIDPRAGVRFPGILKASR